MLLPEHIDPHDFDRRFRRDPAAWSDAVAAICEEEYLPYRTIRTLPDGSSLVAEVDGRWIVKIFPPFHFHQWMSERRGLTQLHGRLSVRTPSLRGEGVLASGWYYVIMDRLEGSTFEQRWSRLSSAEKVALLEQVGTLMAQVHALPVDGIAELSPRWERFLPAQLEGCRARHAARNAPDWLLRDLDPYLAAWAERHAGDPRRVLLTGEYTPFNLLFGSGTPPQLSGMIDFGDLMIGVPEYDLLGPSLFSCEADGWFCAALFRGYYGQVPPLAELRMQLMGLALLHRYANFELQIRIPEWKSRANSLEQLAQLIWPAL